MKAFARMFRLVLGYPRFWGLVATCLLLAILTSAYLGLLHAILLLLQNAASPPEGGNVLFNNPGLFELPLVGGALRGVSEWYAAIPPSRAFATLLGYGIALFFIKCSAEYFRRRQEGWLRARVVRDTQKKLARHLLSLDFAFFQRERQGELVSRLTNDLQMLSNTVNAAGVMVAKPFNLLGALVYVIYLDWRLAAIGLGVLPLGMVGLHAVARRIRKASRRAQEKTADLTEIMMQFLSGIRVVKAFACEDFEASRFDGENEQLFRTSMRRVRARALERVVSEFMTSLAALAVLALGGWWVLTGRLDIATLMTFYAGLAFIHSPVNEISHVYGDIQETVVGADRVFELLDRRPELSPGTRADFPADTTVRFEDVHFAYHADAPVLRGFDLTLPAGKTVALVGRTGAGKSTAADLLLRLRDPQSGRVTIGGVPVSDFGFAALRGGVGLVSQDSFLFNSTLRDNIAYGTPGADPAAIEAAARAAQIHDEILAFPDGYDTVVGDRGTSLSGGQRQRIAIARALFKDAPILILDEATSSLDAGSERRVQEALEVLLRGRTCLVIAHRLSTVRRADAIACLEDGRITAVGTHARMLECSPVYARFVALQTE